MAKVLLFRPIYDPHAGSTPSFPWSLLYVAAPLVNRGVDVTIIDECLTPDYRHQVLEILEKNPVAVGISSMTGEQLRFGLRFARFVRGRSNVPIVWGGVHPTLKPEQTARHELVDYVVVNEGERSFSELVERLEQGGDPGEIPGVIFVREEKVQGLPPDKFIDLSTLPELPYHLMDVERYVVRRSDLGADRCFELCTSRGCPHRCGFCYIQSVHGSRWRRLDADTAFAQLKAHVERFSLDCVVFREDNFFVDRRRVERLAQRMIDERLGIKWTASCRVDYFATYEREFIELIRRSGCVLITFGVESGSDRVLEFIRKDLTVEMVHKVIRTMKESGIRGTYHFMGGFPTETEGELLDTCRLIEEARSIAPEAIVREMSVFTPYPGSSLVDVCRRMGYQEPENLQGWCDMDFRAGQDPSLRPWLSRRQSKLIADVQFLIARLAHPNPVVRTWANRRWRQVLSSDHGISLVERPAIELARRILGRA